MPLSLLQPQLPVIKVVFNGTSRKVTRLRHRDQSRVGLTAAAVEFYSLMQKGNKIGYKLNLPKILPKTRIKLCFSSFGWLVIVSEAEGLKLSLVHPLNQARIDLPDVREFFSHRDVRWFSWWGWCGKFVLSSSPSWTSDYIVMFHLDNILGFCRPGLGQNNWRRINLQREMVPMDLIYYKEQFYFVHHSGAVSVFDIDKKEGRLVTPEFSREQLLGPNVHIKEQYLVESAGVLLVVLFTTTKKEALLGLSYGCRVFEVPFTNSKSWSDSEVRSLGNRTIFLSKCSSSFSIEASDYSGLCKPNCIYFMNDKRVYPRQCRNGGLFIMKDGTFTQDSEKESTQCGDGVVIRKMLFPKQYIDGGVFSLTIFFNMKIQEDSIHGFNRVCKYWTSLIDGSL